MNITPAKFSKDMAEYCRKYQCCEVYKMTGKDRKQTTGYYFPAASKIMVAVAGKVVPLSEWFLTLPGNIPNGENLGVYR